MSTQSLIQPVKQSKWREEVQIGIFLAIVVWIEWELVISGYIKWGDFSNVPFQLFIGIILFTILACLSWNKPSTKQFLTNMLRILLTPNLTETQKYQLYNKVIGDMVNVVLLMENITQDPSQAISDMQQIKADITDMGEQAQTVIDELPSTDPSPEADSIPLNPLNKPSGSN